MAELLGNPVWSSLRSEQAKFCLESGPVVQYPAAVAPFCAVENARAACRVGDIPAGRDVFFVGEIPKFPAGWRESYRGSAVQMVYGGDVEPVEPIEGEVELGEADAGDLLRLTGLAYPEFFRAETWRLGRYIGVRVDGELVAMAGERMRLTGLCEISGVVTHPEHTGKGYASHLMRRLMASIAAGGQTPFLHTGSSNARAIGIYERLGFVLTGELALVKVRRD